MVTSLFQQAAALMQEKRYDEAEPLLLQVNAAAPKDPKVNYLLGVVLSHFGDYKSALSHLLEASKFASKQPEIFAKLSEVYTSLGRPKEGFEAADKAVQLDPRMAFAQLSLGDACQLLHKTDLAREAYAKAIQLSANSVGGHAGLYSLEMGLGNFTKAEEHLAAAIEIDPKHPAVVQLALSNERFEGYPAAAETAIAILARKHAEIKPEMRLGLALLIGKHFEKKGNLNKAFQYFDDFRDQYYNRYDINNRKWQLDRIKNIFSRDFFEQRQGFGISTDRPVFVVGMPRSGTTLVEQILARHPDATGIGEQIFFTDLQQQISGSEYATPALFDFAIETDNKNYKRIGRKYLTTIDKIDRKAKRIVNKMPHNFEMLWMIALLFPGAKIIHVHREPADTCSSIYTTPLERFHSYNIDQETLGRYYGLYAEMMDHWNKVLPVSIHHQSYETLVNDQETQTRALLDYVDLPWNPVCLDFQSGERSVFTFSSQQVRQPIFKSSIGRWRKYEPHIQPLLKGLGKHAPQARAETA